MKSHLEDILTCRQFIVCIEGVLVTNLYHNTVFLSLVFFYFVFFVVVVVVVLFSKAKIAI